jgi:phage N-6-adenine-methyltransferase
MNLHMPGGVTQLPQEALDDTDDRGTPTDLFRWAESLWGPFTVDVAANAKNAKCRRYFDKARNGLAQSWDGERVWCNPPFSDVAPWVEKAWDAHADVVAMLLPANRTEQPWWQDSIERFRDRVGSRLSTHFVPKRQRFLMPGPDPHKGNHRPQFGVVVAVWGPRPMGSGA